MNGGLPVVMAAVTALWVRRVPSVSRISAIVLGFVGIVVVAWPALRTDTTRGATIADLRGVLLLAAALLLYALGANLARPLQAQYSPARLLMRVQIAATLWTLPFAADGASSSDFAWSSVLAMVALGANLARPLQVQYSPARLSMRVQIAATLWTLPFAADGASSSDFAWSSVLAVGALGVVDTGIAFVVFGTLLERTGLIRAMIPTYFTPIVGLVLGTLFNDETIALVSVAGMLVVIASAWMTSKPDERNVRLSDTTR